MRLLFVMLAAAALAASPAVVRAQRVSPTQGLPVPAQVATLAAGVAVAQTGLPQVAPPPRTLRAYWHVFAAFAVTWALLFGYLVVLGRRFGVLEREVRRLEEGRR